MPHSSTNGAIVHARPLSQPGHLLRSATIRHGIVFVLLLLLLGQARASAAVIESLEGTITTHELDSFIADIAQLHPQTSNAGNAMATHKSGTEIAAISTVFEATRDPRLLAHAVRFADDFCAYRNDQPRGTHVVQWTGQIEPVWPMSPTSTSAGGESAMVAGHIGYVAYLILATPMVWGMTVPDNDPNGFGATYKERGLTYLRFTDETLTRYLTRYCIKPGDFSIVNPTKTTADGDAPPWNIQAMYMLPHMYHALCHDLLGDRPADLTLCKGVVNRYATWFVDSAQYDTISEGAGAGLTVAKWYYLVPPDRQRKENQGHAQHDIRGLIAAFHSGYTTLTAEQLRVFANTVHYRMYRGPHRWSDNVHGDGPDRINLKADLIPLAEWDHGIFALAAESDLINDPHVVDSGSETCLNAGFILATKQRLAKSGQAKRP